MLERFDNFATLRNALQGVAERDCEWAGIPMPLDGQRLVIEPTYPNAKALSEIGAPKREELPANVKVRNIFWSTRWRCRVWVYEEDGKVGHALTPGAHHVSLDLETLRSAVAWGIEQEANAIQLLASLLPHHQFKNYLLTGMFLETSQRSGVVYMFRKLKPTVAIRLNTKDDTSRILCTMCMHPIAFYEGSWAGAMAPTDDVIAALMLMRGDEHMFWKRSNQHSPEKPEAGL